MEDVSGLEEVELPGMARHYSDSGDSGDDGDGGDGGDACSGGEVDVQASEVRRGRPVLAQVEAHRYLHVEVGVELQS